MDPCQRARIGGRIGRAIGQSAADAAMDAINPFDRLHRHIAMRESGVGNEMGGARQAPFHVLAEIGEVEHALQRMRVEHLQEQTADTAHHHPDNIGMDHAYRAVPLEQRFVGTGARRGIGIAFVEGRAHAAHYPLAKKFEGVWATHKGDYRLGARRINP